MLTETQKQILEVFKFYSPDTIGFTLSELAEMIYSKPQFAERVMRDIKKLESAGYIQISTIEKHKRIVSLNGEKINMKVSNIFYFLFDMISYLIINIIFKNLWLKFPGIFRDHLLPRCYPKFTLIILPNTCSFPNISISKFNYFHTLPFVFIYNFYIKYLFATNKKDQI